MLDEYTQFDEDHETRLGRRIVKSAAKRTGLDLTFVRWTGEPPILHARSDEWRDIVIIRETVPRGWIIRSVLIQIDNEQMVWDANGHAGSGCEELAWWDENEFIIEDDS